MLRFTLDVRISFTESEYILGNNSKIKVFIFLLTMDFFWRNELASSFP